MKFYSLIMIKETPVRKSGMPDTLLVIPDSLPLSEFLN